MEAANEAASPICEITDWYVMARSSWSPLGGATVLAGTLRVSPSQKKCPPQRGHGCDGLERSITYFLSGGMENRQSDPTVPT